MLLSCESLVICYASLKDLLSRNATIHKCRCEYKYGKLSKPSLAVPTPIFAMAHKTAIILSLAVSTLLVTAATIKKRIAGGEDAKEGEFPFMVSL